MTFFKKTFSALKMAAILVLALQSCQSCQEIDQEAYYTFKGETVVSYLEKNPNQFSEFSGILKHTGLDALLSTYGTFTCFIPTNEAMRAYYADSSKSSYDEFSVEALREMVYYQIIDTEKYLSTDFPQGRLSNKNMMSRFIDISFAKYAEDGGILVNSSSTIKLKDQEVHNGVIHVIDKVLVPSNYLLPESIRSDSAFSIFAEALYLTGMSDSLLGIIDDSYVQPISFLDANNSTVQTPPNREYGYTALVEPDSIYAEYGIYDLDDLIAYAASVYDEVFPEDVVYANDYTHRKNSLNRFVSYHLFDYLCDYNRFVDYYYNHGGIMDGKEGVEYIQTMCPNTLLEVRAGNRFNVQSNGEHISILGGEMEHTLCVNGIFYPIDKILLYDGTVINDVLNKRLRMDVYSTLPEMMKFFRKTSSMPMTILIAKTA
ncbi:MAG: fasciclin domain-containing protein [Bacteroidales bacterium]|nr:fasciclin domain-containing protein [Bacteroidales bacterium]